VSETGYSTERKLYGTNRLLIGFIVGAVFALIPTYYFYMGREAALRGVNPVHDQVFTTSSEPAPTAVDPARAARGSEKPFASRLTYELSQLPEEPLPTVAKAPAAAGASSAAPPGRDPETSAARVANARPISALPPDPRDRTGAIEKETQMPEYREAARRETPAAAPHARVYAGREVELKELKAPPLPEMPTRPIVASASDSRAEIAAERARSSVQDLPSRQATGAAAEKTVESRSVVVPGPPVAGVTPITRAPQEPLRQEVVAKARTTAASAVSERAAPAATTANAQAGTVESRLAATREWLAAAPSTTHTLQLMGTGSEEQLQEHLRSLGKVLEPGRIRVFRTMAQGKPSITVVYGEYADRKSALQALEKLPPALTANRPVLRTVNGIRVEMKQHKTDG
jgi:septal ring-binding cell division protein DamX